MKAIFYSIETKTEPWVEAGKTQYQKKIQPFFPFEIETIKSPAMDRGDAQLKKRAEAEKIQKRLEAKDFLILLDEKGRSFTDSESLAAEMSKTLERSPSRLIFLVGGAFGIDDSIRKRAQAIWSLGPLTYNHWIAQLVALEQIYRSLTIIKRIPYHNR